MREISPSKNYFYIQQLFFIQQNYLPKKAHFIFFLDKMVQKAEKTLTAKAVGREFVRQVK